MVSKIYDLSNWDLLLSPLREHILRTGMSSYCFVNILTPGPAFSALELSFDQKPLDWPHDTKRVSDAQQGRSFSILVEVAGNEGAYILSLQSGC